MSAKYSAIVKDGPAAKAGIKEKDIIKKLIGIVIMLIGSALILILKHCLQNKIN